MRCHFTHLSQLSDLMIYFLRGGGQLKKNQTSFLSQHPSSPSWPSPPSLWPSPPSLPLSRAMPLGCGGRVQGARQDLVQVDLHCWYNKTNQASLYNGCDISRGSKTNSVHLTPCTIQHPTNIPHHTHPQAAYCGCAGEGHWQVQAGLQGGSRPGLLQLIQNCFFFLFQAKFTFTWNSSSTNFPSSWISAVAWFLFNLSHGSSCGISPIKDHFGAAEMISFYSTFSPFLPKHKRGDY